MDQVTDRWLLPDGVEEVLPGQASSLEALRRRLLDLYARHGYELVMTPLIEYLESLLVTGSRALDLQTFKLTDQLTGRMMGVRADITPQVARIDAHSLAREGAVRLCYAGSVLHTRPAGLAASRSPIQTGVELFGHAGLAADIEVMGLMVRTLQAAGISAPQMDLGHVGLFRHLSAQAGFDAQQEAELFALMQRKALVEIDGWLQSAVADTALRAMLAALPRMHGGRDMLDSARSELSAGGPQLAGALDVLIEASDRLREREPEVSLYFDLSELRGYHYHTGLVFSAYLPGHGEAIAKGGRYDDIGRQFGRARPATGFSADLKMLAMQGQAQATPAAILAPPGADADCRRLVEELRASGEAVIEQLDEHDGAELGAVRRIVNRDGQWVVAE